MFLIEENQIADAALPLDGFRRHLRLGTGFAEDSLQDPVLRSFLRAAVAAIEGRTSRALITRAFSLSLPGWRKSDGQALPVAPVGRLLSVTIHDADGNADTLDPAAFRIEQNGYAPVLRTRRIAMPTIPAHGRAEIRFEAGHGADLDAVPADLHQAVMLLAAHYYEFRDETALSQGCMPFGVTSLIARYMPVRLGLGA